MTEKQADVSIYNETTYYLQCMLLYGYSIQLFFKHISLLWAWLLDACAESPCRPICTATHTLGRYPRGYISGRATCPRPAVFNSLETAGAVEILLMIGYEKPTDIYS